MSVLTVQVETVPLMFALGMHGRNLIKSQRKQRMTTKNDIAEKYHNIHNFVGGRCWKCQINPDYLREYRFAFINGDITEEHLRRISPCHEKIIVVSKVREDENGN